MPRQPSQKLKATAKGGTSCGKSLEDYVQESPELVLLRKLLHEERQRREKAEALHSVVVSAARDILEPLRLPSLVKPYTNKPESSSTPEAQILHLSDLHIGQETEHYSIEIFERQMETLFSKTLHIAEIMRRDHAVEELFIALNGDLVEGEQIFPGQAWLTRDSVLSQCVRGAHILSAKIAKISPHYRSVRIVVTRGNHGKSGKHWSEESNWDLVLGELIKHLLSKLDNVKVSVCTDWYASTKVAGKIVVQSHGDRIRSGGDTPFTAILKRSNLWRTALPESFDILLLGHFHSEAKLGFQKADVFVNGTTVPMSDYALSYMGMVSRPVQQVIFVHPRIGVTYYCPIYVDDLPKPAKRV